MKITLLKVNFQTIAIVSALLLCSCTGEKKEVVYGTIADVNGSEQQVVTDNLGNEIKQGRKIEDKYPELDVYTGVDRYEEIYVPILGKCFSSDDYYCVEHNAEYVMIADKDDLDTTYTFGRINNLNIAAMDNSEPDAYTMFSSVYPLTEYGFYDGNSFSTQTLIQTQIESISENWIAEKKAIGYEIEALSDFHYDPTDVYMACLSEDKSAEYALMVSFAREENYEAMHTIRYGRSNLLYQEAKDAPKTTYKVYQATHTFAVPSYIEVETTANGLRMHERSEEVTPFTGSGCTLMTTSIMLNTKEQTDELMSELNSIADEDYKYDVVKVNYETDVDFMGVSDATHLSGVMNCKEGGLDMRKNISGTGEVCFDIYMLNRNGQNLLVMYYYEQNQSEEFENWIKYNTY